MRNAGWRSERTGLGLEMGVSSERSSPRRCWHLHFLQMLRRAGRGRSCQTTTF